MNSHQNTEQNWEPNMTVLERKEQLQQQLKAELEESEWLNKFKQLSELLTTIKTAIPATIFCELRWLTEEETLLIHCPNPETKTSLENQTEDFIRICSFAKRFVITYINTPDLVITCPKAAGMH